LYLRILHCPVKCIFKKLACCKFSKKLCCFSSFCSACDKIISEEQDRINAPLSAACFRSGSLLSDARTVARVVPQSAAVMAGAGRLARVGAGLAARQANGAALCLATLSSCAARRQHYHNPDALVACAARPQTRDPSYLLLTHLQGSRGLREGRSHTLHQLRPPPSSSPRAPAAKSGGDGWGICKSGAGEDEGETEGAGRRRAATNGGRRGREERVRECSGPQPNGRRVARAEPIERPMLQICQVERSVA
jgi:hypothetical protein